MRKFMALIQPPCRCQYVRTDASSSGLLCSLAVRNRRMRRRGGDEIFPATILHVGLFSLLTDECMDCWMSDRSLNDGDELVNCLSAEKK